MSSTTPPDDGDIDELTGCADDQSELGAAVAAAGSNRTANLLRETRRDADQTHDTAAGQTREAEQRRLGASFALGGFPRVPPHDEPAACREAWLQGYDQSAATTEDARIFGSGLLMVTPDGCLNVPIEAVSIDRSKLRDR